jgi:hypothetical protein
MTPQQLEVKAKNDAIYKEAIKWEAKKFYIVRGIDKGQEKDGVKFWRFTKTIFEQLITIIEAKEYDLSDISNGVDIRINLKKDGKKTVVSGIVDLSPSELKRTIEAPENESDEDKAVREALEVSETAEWLANDQEWKDVYKKYDYNFLKIVVEGGTPIYSKEANAGKGGYIDKNAAIEADNQDYGNDLSIGGAKTVPTVPAATSTPAATESATADDDDLPF